MRKRSAASRSIEYAGGITTLRAFGYASESFDALRKSFDELRQASIGREEASRSVGLFGRCIITAGVAVVMLVGALLAHTASVEAFSLLMSLLLTLSVYEPIVTLFYYISDYAGAEAAGERIAALMEEPELALEPGGAEPTDASICFERASFSYGGEGGPNAPEDVTLSMPEGSLTALVGPSGSGKSTACRLAARFWDPQAGRVTLGGIDERSLDADDVLSHVAIVFQDVFLF